MDAFWTKKGQAEPVADDELLAEVRRGLAHLYDPIYLQRSPLMALLSAQEGELSPGQGARALRRLLVETIEQLAPGDNVPLRSKERRSYAALRGFYVDQLPVKEVAEALAISPRQLRRELRAGLEAATSIIAHRLGWKENKSVLQDRETMPFQGQVLSEIETLGLDTGPVNLCAELRNVEGLAVSLAGEMGVTLRSEGIPESVVVRANRVLLRQVLLALYSWTIQQHRVSVIESRLVPSQGDDVVFELTWGREDGEAQEVLDPSAIVSSELLRALGDTLESAGLVGDRGVLRLRLPRMPRCSLLLIDDNHGLHHLFRRYLSGLPYALQSAYDVPTGLALARASKPQIIVLDLMMPDRDGWELLAALKEDDATRDIPVIICSVLEQEALARSLHVQGYIKKPVTQSALLNALQTLDLESLA